MASESTSIQQHMKVSNNLKHWKCNVVYLELLKMISCWNCCHFFWKSGIFIQKFALDDQIFMFGISSKRSWREASKKYIPLSIRWNFDKNSNIRPFHWMEKRVVRRFVRSRWSKLKPHCCVSLEAFCCTRSFYVS